MEHFSEEHSKHLLSKEWLVKIDSQRSTPYLIKFYSSTADLSCCVLLTDTKSTWAEVLTNKQFARRWRDCNRLDLPLHEFDNMEEEAWRISSLELLSKAHTLGGITDLSFEVVESNYADFAFELECEAFKWRWETCFLGHKLSAEIISKHLVMPLISVNYLAFSSADPVCELTDTDLEKAVDKVGRTARRTVDTHIKHAISKPRVATTLRRMTAMFDFTPDLPAIYSTAEKPELQVHPQLPKIQTRLDSPIKSRSISPEPIPRKHKTLEVMPAIQAPSPERGDILKPPVHTDSATESEDEASASILDKGKDRAVSDMRSSSKKSPEHPNTTPSRPISPLPNTFRGSTQPKAPESDSESSPARPVKKPKHQASSSEDDSEAERKKRVAQLKSGAGAGAVKRGTRQPIKRGGKRF